MSDIPDEICQANPDIPWQDMRAMRNFVVIRNLIIIGEAACQSQRGIGEGSPHSR
jgi:uncharacterized protein with HEPN domain